MHASINQWYALYVFLSFYEYVTRPDCFIGHSCPCGVCPESGPLSLTYKPYYLAMCPTDDWHLANIFSWVYFAVAVCLKGLYYHSVSSRPGLCVRFHSPPHWPTPSQVNTKRVGVEWYPAPHLSWVRGGGRYWFRVLLFLLFGCVLG